MARQVRTHLMFDDNAEEAMKFYVSLLPQSKIIECTHYQNGEGQEKVQQAYFTLGRHEFICIDTPVKHDFSFTPDTSIFVDCESDEELEILYATLSEGGRVFMPLGNYGFSKRFGWVGDRFGVSWQLNLS